MTTPIKITGSSVLPVGPAKTVTTPTKPVTEAGEFTLADVDPVGRTEVILYGPPKSGKTVCAATFPGPFRWVAADGENSLKSVRWAYKAGLTSLTALDQLRAYAPREDTSDAERYYPKSAKAFWEMQDRIGFWFTSEQVDKWETLVIDSLTEVNLWALNLGLDLNNQLPNVSHPLSGSHAINLKAKVRLVTGQQDYKSAMGLIEGFITDIRGECAKHGKNLVMICHEWTETKEGEDGTERVVRYRPLLIGQLREQMAKAFDDVWHVRQYKTPTTNRATGGQEVKVLMHADPTHIAGTRWGACVNAEEPADYRQIIAKVKAYHATENAKGDTT